MNYLDFSLSLSQQVLYISNLEYYLPLPFFAILQLYRITMQWSASEMKPGERAQLTLNFFHQKTEAEDQTDLENLTAREHEVLNFISKGCQVKEVSRILGISRNIAQLNIHKPT